MMSCLIWIQSLPLENGNVALGKLHKLKLKSHINKSYVTSHGLQEKY